MDRYKNEKIEDLVERAKELECLYRVDEALTGNDLREVLLDLCEVIPFGFRDMKNCCVEIGFDASVYRPAGFFETQDGITAEIVINGERRGYIKAAYSENAFPKEANAFLEQEKRLLHTIANRVAESIFRRDHQNTGDVRSAWEAIVRLLEKTDHGMLLHVCEKMLALYASISPHFIQSIFEDMGWVDYYVKGETNFPLESLPDFDVVRLSGLIFRSARACLPDSQIYDSLGLWIYQGKTYELVKAVNKRESDVKSISNALSYYLKAVKGNEMASEATRRWLTVELIYKFLTDKPNLVTSAQRYISIEDVHDFLEFYICSPNRIGKIGGKGAGFLIANRILEAFKDRYPEFENIRMPKTWYISSEEFLNVLEINGLEELNEHKYLDLTEIRTAYPRIVQTLKKSKLSSYVLNRLEQILDACEDKPLIVRSSSLLEDQMFSSFSGKYKSLFLSNTGSRQTRRERLEEAILEVYASIFNPDAIQYKKERNLIDYQELMGVMIQEVVGQKIGPYYFPLFAGVAFSNNELRWSRRIKREDGLLRLVMGLGTRAVDRVGDDFPVLVSPGQPNLRASQSAEEMKKYSPQMIDVIDMENDRFLTLPISQLLKEAGDSIPHIDYAASVVKNDILLQADRLTTDLKTQETVIAFTKLIEKTPLIKRIRSMLSVLRENLGFPVDIEFAGDGENFYLLQCRSQSRSRDDAPPAVPANIPAQNLVFTANKYISNGMVTGVKTVVYVDPSEYGELKKREDFFRVADAVRELNSILPKRSFILMGPGRWGSRGDIKLGVPVTYSDINNSSMLIEIAQKQSKYQPELSFGTHFFQDLVEENIKYLPLYPEDGETVFSKSFFFGCKNVLTEILPSYAELADVIKVISIENNYGNKELIVLMNADLETAVAYMDEPALSASALPPVDAGTDGFSERSADREEGWKWRHYMAEQIARQLDMESFGVKGIYLFGSTNNCTARHNSDIDLIVHVENGRQRKALETWLKGWSLALSEINFLKTGYRSEGLLDVHFVTDMDIAEKNSYAVKINSVYDPAFPLRIREA